jgi:hypothetical protein
MNESHYPPSPSYYRRHPNIDARDLVSPDYWTDSALVHLMRAGRKDGEPFADAVRNAFVCLALWFRSQSLPVPFYSAELDRLQARIRELERAEDDRGIADAVRQMNDPAWQPARATFAKLKESREECADLRDERARMQSRIAELEAANQRLHRRPVLELLELDAPFGPVDLGPFSLNATGTGNPQWITVTRPPTDEEDTGHLHSVRADSPLEAVAKLAPWLLERYLDAECERTALRARVAELEAAALSAVSRPVAPTLDTPAVEWTDAELREWATRTHGKPQRPNEWRMCWDWLGDANRWSLVYSGGWHGHAIGSPSKGITATEAARILNAVKPDPFAGLLEVSDDAALEAWLTGRYGEPASDQLDCGVGSATIRRWHDADRNLVCATWFYGWQKWQVPRGGNVDAPTAARTLHRILTGGKP